MNSDYKNEAPLEITDMPNAKERLLEAAIDVFGKYGFTGATTRIIAQRADVNISAIPYYFNGKEGLYHAVIEHISKIIQGQIRETIKSIEERLQADDVESKEATALLEKLLSRMIDFILGSTQAPRFMRIILREQLDPSEAYDTIYSRVMTPVITAIAKMITVIAHVATTKEAHLRAVMVMGQILAFRMARETVVRMLDVKGYTPEETVEIKKMITEQTRAALKGLSQTKIKT
jgi:AcrR family transcriptional regulator